MQLPLQPIYAYLPSAWVEQSIWNVISKENFARISQRGPIEFVDWKSTWDQVML